MAYPQVDPRQRRDGTQGGEAYSGLVQVPPPMLEACRSASLLMGGQGLTRLGVSSALRGEGRTSIALALAAVHREDYGRSVILADMDFENPMLTRHHGLDPWPGLAEVVRGQFSVDQILQPVADGVQVMTRGVITEGSARCAYEIVNSTLLSEAGQHADVLIADLPPLLGAGPGPVLSRGFDQMLLVVRAGVTPMARVREAAAELPAAPNVLLNGSYSSMPTWIRRLLGK
jgi:Mrp family chromosome partitioning ATPase